MTRSVRRRTPWAVVAALAAGCAAGPLFAPPLQAQAPAAPDIVGTWEGRIEAGGVTLRLAFHLGRKDDGSYFGTMDSLDQGATGLPFSGVTLKGDGVRLDLGMAGASYEGKLSADGSKIDGKWTQSGQSVPLNMTRSAKPAAPPKPIVRPQVPKKPYPYLEEEVGYDNRKAGVHFAATLTLPRGKGPFPAVVLITGSGAQNRDEELMGHKPFLILADYLTRRGIAVLRADDRGIGGSTGNVSQSTTIEFAGDALAGVAYLRSRPEIDKRRIGLIGHSEGGVIAPLAASQSKDVAFIVMMAGTGVPGDRVIISQTEAIGKLRGLSAADIRTGNALNRELYAIMRSEKDETALKEKLTAAMRRAYDRMTDAQKKAAGDPESGIKQQLAQAMSPWFRCFVVYDPRPALRKVRCPVLAINGEKDQQVLPDLNLPEIRAALKAGGNKDYTVQELPGLNHLFQTAPTGSPTEYATIDETMSPRALKVMGDWIVKHTRGNPPRP